VVVVVGIWIRGFVLKCEKKLLRRRESNPDLLGSNDLKANDAKPLHHVEQLLDKSGVN